MGKGFITWNVRSLYRSGLLAAVSREVAKNSIHLLVVQGRGWGRGGTERAEIYSFYLQEQK